MLRYKKLITIIGLLTFSSSLFSQNPKRSFPQHVRYFDGVIKPNHVSQKELDNSVRSFYILWKARYINTNCNNGQYYVWFEKPGQKQSVSEGQGYGMMIVALMAGYDKKAKATYDGLFKYYKAHPSKRDPHLMAWAQNNNCKDISGSSATDGDMDIAYSLLLADKQWGSKGDINYHDEARQMIASIMKQEINPKTFSVILSNSVEYDSRDYFDTRSSDFMPAHFREFKTASNNAGWDKVVDRNYTLFQFLQHKYSPDAGLIPDFIQHINKKPVPARAHYLESPYDGYYNYNACRVPWRIATDYILYGDKRSKAVVDKINTWIRTTTNGNPDNISAGYTLQGNDLKGRYFEALSFIAPFAVSAMVDQKNQVWLNHVWDYLLKFDMDGFDYYDNSIKMINMIILSGNYWAPGK
ncbi:glycosyl hydrolase family 8 [Mucilaginibacter paludis]|uniref:Glucanase n=1 Tax=Mucilaginibacter paludis DSM 18603 TaxID=714943 RepID=H1Y041_9SPHI|nr:glycosyl hydrolase family 8 [Mucilaginibacter paludis]EHQ27950.1 glycoside hydrolase family 8 [Mucilaginibacter paludis DSM 18603]